VFVIIGYVRIGKETVVFEFKILARLNTSAVTKVYSGPVDINPICELDVCLISYNSNVYGQPEH
jgi:hypothetical protein